METRLQGKKSESRPLTPRPAFVPGRRRRRRAPGCLRLACGSSRLLPHAPVTRPFRHLTGSDLPRRKYPGGWKVGDRRVWFGGVGGCREVGPVPGGPPRAWREHPHGEDGARPAFRGRSWVAAGTQTETPILGSRGRSAKPPQRRQDHRHLASPSASSFRPFSSSQKSRVLYGL